MTRILISAVLALVVLAPAAAQTGSDKASSGNESAFPGVRVEVVQSSSTTSATQPERRGQGTRTIEIDGSRFRIIGIGGGVGNETSLDDGATTFFGSDRTKTQTPLTASTSGHIGAAGSAGVDVSLENEKLTVGVPQPGQKIAGVVTQTYSVDCTYDTVMRGAGVTNRLPASEHYELSVSDIGVSSAAVRVVLSRGFGMTLARHPEAFRGFPLRIDGHLVQGDGHTAGFTTDFRLEVVSVTAWGWPGE